MACFYYQRYFYSAGLAISCALCLDISMYFGKADTQKSKYYLTQLTNLQDGIMKKRAVLLRISMSRFGFGQIGCELP
jgi:hypothetical protein